MTLNLQSKQLIDVMQGQSKGLTWLDSA